jgi:hypothetical protein
VVVEEEEEEVVGLAHLPPTAGPSPEKKGVMRLFKRNRKSTVLPDEESPLSKVEEEEKPKAPSMGRLVKLNAAEWPLMLLGVLASAGLGCTMPLFAVALSSIIAVFYNPDPVDMKNKVNGNFCSNLYAFISFVTVKNRAVLTPTSAAHWSLYNLPYHYHLRCLKATTWTSHVCRSANVLLY